MISAGLRSGFEDAFHSDLFHRANEIARSGSEEQRAGVAHFRRALRRFVTLGSPLDKIAVLFGEEALRPWPEQDRDTLLEGGEPVVEPLPEPEPGEARSDGPQPKTTNEPEEEWWVNFYNIFDPVSGALGNEMICGERPPLNLLSSFRLTSLIPGVAHIQYWSDSERTLRFLLSRTYGPKFLRDKAVDLDPESHRMLMGVLGYVFWAALLVGLAAGAIRYAPDLWDVLIRWMKGMLPW